MTVQTLANQIGTKCVKQAAGHASKCFVESTLRSSVPGLLQRKIGVEQVVYLCDSACNSVQKFFISGTIESKCASLEFSLDTALIPLNLFVVSSASRFDREYKTQVISRSRAQMLGTYLAVNQFELVFYCINGTLDVLDSTQKIVT